MPDEARILTVGQLNDFAKMTLENNPVLNNVWVRGEISNFKHHFSGHMYFSVKDNAACIAAVMFRSSAEKLKFQPYDGMKVLLRGKVTLFPKDGKYQIYVSSMQPDGIGALYIAFEKLKAKLEAEGLFDEEIKKPIPKIPSAVGVITSPTGAAVRDIINVTGRRFPFAEVVLFPAQVQGEGAEQELIDGIRYFSTTRRVDVVIIGRGGGSIEDLWAFNSEALAREIRRSSVPVISAVGHETDFTICDFAADRRAPTPSAGAEIAVPDSGELKRKLGNVSTHMATLLSRETVHFRQRLSLLAGSRVLTSPTAYIDDRRNLLLSLSSDMERAVTVVIIGKRNGYARLSAVLNAVSPLKVISKGYSAVFRDDGQVVRSVRDVIPGDRITLRVSDGTVNADVVSVCGNEKKDKSEKEISRDGKL